LFPTRPAVLGGAGASDSKIVGGTLLGLPMNFHFLFNRASDVLRKNLDKNISTDQLRLICDMVRGNDLAVTLEASLKAEEKSKATTGASAAKIGLKSNSSGPHREKWDGHRAYAGHIRLFPVPCLYSSPSVFNVLRKAFTLPSPQCCTSTVHLLRTSAGLLCVVPPSVETV
jgi:hypothetical protein